MLINLYEKVVESRAADAIRRLGVCDCPECYEDICAITLNRLPSKYVSSRGGEVFSQFTINTTQGDAELTTALIMAAKTVSENPRHGWAR